MEYKLNLKCNLSLDENALKGPKLRTKCYKKPKQRKNIENRLAKKL